MAKDWDYAQLSKAAKAAGSPEKLVDLIASEAKQQGRNEMTPVIGLVAAAAVGATIGITKVIEYLKAKKAKSEQELEEAKTELIEGIKEYDANHLEDNGDQ